MYPDKLQWKKGLRFFWNATAQIMEMSIVADPDAASSVPLSGAAEGDGGFVTLRSGYSYVLRFEVIARTASGPLYMSEYTATAYRIGTAPAQVEMAVETRKLYTDEITVAVLPGDQATDPGHDFDVFCRVGQPAGSKSVSVRAFIESESIV
jgi:hypothetical protein